MTYPSIKITYMLPLIWVPDLRGKLLLHSCANKIC